MRILHTSDIHLDSRLSSRLSPDKAKVRKRELLSNLSRLLSEAKRLGCEAMIIAGDLFDSERVSARALDTALDAISSCPELSVFYLPGNHEKSAIISSGKSLPKNLFIFGEDWTYFKARGVVIAGRSRCSENMFESLDFAEDTVNIAVLHGELRDRSAAPDTVGIRDASEKNINYIALGHYHSYREYPIAGGGIAVYSGTPEGRGFDECGECGFVLIDTEEGLRHKFIRFAKRVIHNIKVDITGKRNLGEVHSAAVSALSGIRREDLVRLELAGERELTLWLDGEAIKDKLGEHYFSFEVKDNTRLHLNIEDYRYDRSLRGEFIRLVSSREDLDELTKERVIETGLYALMGEEIG